MTFITNFFTSLLAVPLGWLMRGCYWLADSLLNLPLSYVFALLFFTVVTKLLMFPLSAKQHISTARMQAFNPLILEIQQKYKNDREKQAKELEALYSEYNYSPTQGCMPMLVSLIIMFGLVEVIYKPLSYMLMLPKEFISSLTARTLELSAAAGGNLTANNRMIETFIIDTFKSNPSAFADLTANYAAEVDKINALQMSIGSINLCQKSELALSWALLIPIFSIVTQLLSVWVTMRTNASLDGEMARQQNSMLVSTVLMGAIFTFMYPLGFALYWGFQNLLGMFQSLLLKKVWDPVKIKEDVLEDIKRKKKEKKSRRTVSYMDKESGKVVEKEMSAAEADRLRLQRAREIDAERYGE